MSPLKMKKSPIVTARLRRTPKSVSPFKPQPPFRKVAKNDGPTCNPIKNTKRMRPKFLKNAMRSGFT